MVKPGEVQTRSPKAGYLSTLLCRPTVRLVALVAATLQVAGCYVNERRPLPTPVAVTDPMVVNWNEYEWTLLDTRLDGDTLVGRGVRLGEVMPRYPVRVLPPDTVEVRIPVTELYQIDRHFHGYRTALLLPGIVGGAFLAMMIVIESTGGIFSGARP